MMQANRAIVGVAYPVSAEVEAILSADSKQLRVLSQKRHQRNYHRHYSRERKRVSPTFTAWEYETLKRDAEIAGMQTPSYLKAFYLEGRKNQQVRSKAFEEETKRIFWLLSNVSSNLNQLTKYTHQQGKATAPDRFNIQQHLDQLCRLEEKLARFFEQQTQF